MATTISTSRAAVAAAAVDWEQMETWDRAYYLHNVQGAEEHVWNGVAYETRIVAREAVKHGVFLTGFVPNTIKVAPPLTVTPDEVDLTLEAFDAGLDEVERIHH